MENISELSLLEVAIKLIEEKQIPVNIYDLINEVLELKGIATSDLNAKTKLYVDITSSSKFVFMGDDEWDLKINQSLDQFDKDGSAFNPKGAIDEDEDELESEDELDDINENISYDDEEDEYETKSDDSDDDDDDDDDRKAYDDEDEEDEDSELEYDDEEDMEEFEEDKYNKYMDDYEDMYDDN